LLTTLKEIVAEIRYFLDSWHANLRPAKPSADPIPLLLRQSASGGAAWSDPNPVTAPQAFTAISARSTSAGTSGLRF